MMKLLAVAFLLTILSPARLATAQPEDALETLASMPIQDRGRVKPWDTYARQIATSLTGRAKWSKDRGPEAFSGRPAIALLADLMFRGA